MQLRLLTTALFMSFFSCLARGQESMLPVEDFIRQVLTQHPLAQRAGLQTARASAEMMKAKGLLDPKIEFDWSQKEFDEKLYYRKLDGRITLPTLLGIEAVAGYQSGEGSFLNPELSTIGSGLYFAGVEIQLGQGLWINERRTAIEKAKVNLQLTANEQEILVNELMFQALQAYLAWQQLYTNQAVLSENLDLLGIVLTNVKESYRAGESTGLDTLEALINYQDARLNFDKNNLALMKAKQHLENFLWEDGSPVVLREGLYPADVDALWIPGILEDESTAIVRNHPILRQYQNKLEIADLNLQLSREKLKPKLTLKYQPLLLANNPKAYSFNVDADYVFGLGFSMPVLLRSARGDIEKDKIKINELNLELANKRNELLNKLQALFIEQNLLSEQINITQQNVERYQNLLNGENEKFQLGESSIFLLNKRQEKYLESQLKLIDLKTLLQMRRLTYYYFANQLANV